MKTFPPDILTVKTKAGVRHWLAHHVVVQMGGYSEDYLKNKRKDYKHSVPQSQRGWAFMPDTGHVWRWARKHGTFYYALDNLPRRLRDMARAYVEDVHSQGVRTLRQEIEQYIRDHLNDWLPVYAGESYKRAKELATAACVVDFLAAHFPERGRKALLEEVVRFRYAYIPKTWLTLYRKVRAYMDGVPMDELIRLPRYGNRNALRYDDDEVKAWIIALRADGHNYTAKHIARKVREMCVLAGKPAPSERWIENFVASPEVEYLTALERYGSGRLANRYKPYIPVKRPMYAGDAWQIDATRVNMIAHRDAAGKERHLFMVTVRDVYSGDVLGYHFDYKEDRWAVLNAVKMAVMEAEYLPYQMIFDRFPGHNTPEAEEFFDHLRALGVKVSFTHKATGKAQLERWFGTLQTVFMQDSEYYYGEGVQSRRPYAHRSPEYLARLKRQSRKEGWDLERAVNEAARVIEAYRNTPYSVYSRKYARIDKSPKQLHAESEKPNVRQATRGIIYALFAYKKEVNIRRGGMIRTEIYKQELYYHVDDHDLVKRHRTLWIAYMPDDLDTVELFVRKGPFWVPVGTARAVEPVEIYGPQAQFDGLGRLKKKLAEMDEKRRAELEEIIAQAGEMELLLGRYARKEDANAAETVLVSGDEVMMEAYEPVVRQAHQPSGKRVYKQPPPDAMPGDDDWLINQL